MISNLVFMPLVMILDLIAASANLGFPGFEDLMICSDWNLAIWRLESGDLAIW